MRILMISLRYPPAIGGAELALARLAAALAQRGCLVDVIAGAAEGEGHADLPAGVRLHRVRLPGRHAAGLTFAWRALKVSLRLGSIDIVHAHSATAPAAAAMLIARIRRAPLVVKPTSGMVGGNLGDVTSRPLGNLRVSVLRSAAAHFVAVSREIAQSLMDDWRIPPDRIHAIPNGVPVSADDSRRSRSGSMDSTRFLFVGRIDSVKGADLLIDAWIEAREPGTLTVVGDGPLREVLERVAPRSVRFVGPVDDARVYYLENDVFVLPSRREGLSNALLEACAAGLPVIATDVGGTSSVLGRYGCLIPPDDLSSLAGALLDPPDAATPQEALADYSIDRVAEQHLDLYASLVSRRG